MTETAGPIAILSAEHATAPAMFDELDQALTRLNPLEHAHVEQALRLAGSDQGARS